MAKRVKDYTFKTIRSRLNFNEDWLDGKVWELDESDLGKFGEAGAKGKISTLRSAVGLYETYGCYAEADETNTKIMFQAFERPKK